MIVLQEDYFALSPSSYQSASTVNIAIFINHLLVRGPNCKFTHVFPVKAQSHAMGNTPRHVIKTQSSFHDVW